jgi:hypothetical protein
MSFNSWAQLLLPNILSRPRYRSQFPGGDGSVLIAATTVTNVLIPSVVETEFMRRLIQEMLLGATAASDWGQ